MALHAQILQIMGQIASSTAIPPSFLYPLGAAFLPALALAGVAIATLGAWLPAQWAAHGKVVAILQAE
jgi:putative ABC transport system permease protein